MRSRLLCAALVVFGVGCGRISRPKGGGPGAGGGMDPAVKDKDCTATDPDGDQDLDGYTPAQGDCNDCNRAINPGAIQIANDPVDYACNGMPGVVESACDLAVAGMRDATALAAAFDQCDPRFFKGAQLVGPSDKRARKAVPKFGVIHARYGKGMALLSSGTAADKSDPNYLNDEKNNPGTDFGDNNVYANPLPDLPASPDCSSTQPAEVNDYTELVVKLKAPSNANSFSFDFQFFSAEYPEFVCTEYNDEFLVLQESANEFAMPTNIAFDMQKNPVTINNGFFTVCTNDNSKKQTQHCTMPVSGINGTGFEDPVGGFGGGTPGGSTGWLTTTSPVTPGEEVTLHYIIFDEGDHILDSSVLIDNFQWSAESVNVPVTVPIQ